MHYLPVIILPFGLAYSYYYGFTPLLLPLAFIVISILTYYVYAKDKSAAARSEWRVPENTLHLHSLLFGWPGTIIAQQRLRHKTRKTSFRIVFWLTVIINVSTLGWAHTKKGNNIVYNSVITFESILLGKVTDNTVSRVIRILTGFNKKRYGYIYKS